MIPAVPLATLRGIAAMAPRRLRRELKIAIKQIERAFPPVFAICVKAPAAPTLTPSEIEADKNAAEGRAQAYTGAADLRFDPADYAAVRGGITRCLSETETNLIRISLASLSALHTQTLRSEDFKHGLTLIQHIESILGRQVVKDGETVTLPPGQVIITNHPEPRVDTDALHRKLDEVRSKLGVEDTEAFRALLPAR